MPWGIVECYVQLLSHEVLQVHRLYLQPKLEVFCPHLQIAFQIIFFLQIQIYFTKFKCLKHCAICLTLPLVVGLTPNIHSIKKIFYFKTFLRKMFIANNESLAMNKSEKASTMIPAAYEYHSHFDSFFTPILFPSPRNAIFPSTRSINSHIVVPLSPTRYVSMLCWITSFAYRCFP